MNPINPSPLSPEQINRLFIHIKPKETEAHQLKGIIQFVKETYIKPSTLLPRLEITLSEGTFSSEASQNLTLIKATLSKYVDKLKTLAPEDRGTSSSGYTASAGASSNIPENRPPSPSQKDKERGASAMILPKKAQSPHPTKKIFFTSEDRANTFCKYIQKQSQKSSSTHLPDLYEPYSEETHRFTNILCRKETIVDKALNANRIKIGIQPIAIACQYPRPSQIESHLGMLYENRATLLCILSSPEEIKKTQEEAENAPFLMEKTMPNYHLKTMQYGDYRVSSNLREKVQFDGNLTSSVYALSIHNIKENRKISIPMIHVENWQDHQAISAKALKELAQKALSESATMKEAYKSSRSFLNPEKCLPVIHCRAGVGRTGTLIAEMAMQSLSKEIPLQTIITDIRESRNEHMVQTQEQMNLLIKSCTLSQRHLYTQTH